MFGSREARVEVDHRDVVGAEASARAHSPSRLSAAFVVVYPSSVPKRIGPSPDASTGACKSPWLDVMLTITPPPAGRRCGTTRPVSTNGAWTLTSNCRRHDPSGYSSTAARAPLRVGGVVHEPVDATEMCDGASPRATVELLGIGRGRRRPPEPAHPRLSISATASPTEPTSRACGSTVRAATTTFVPCRARASASCATDAAAGAGHDRHSIEELHVRPRRITARRGTAHSWRSIDVGRRRMTTRCSSSMVVRNSSIGVSGIPYDIRMAWNASTRSGIVLEQLTGSVGGQGSTAVGHAERHAGLTADVVVLPLACRKVTKKSEPSKKHADHRRLRRSVLPAGRQHTESVLIQVLLVFGAHVHGSVVPSDQERGRGHRPVRSPIMSASHVRCAGPAAGVSPRRPPTPPGRRAHAGSSATPAGFSSKSPLAKPRRRGRRRREKWSTLSSISLPSGSR